MNMHTHYNNNYNIWIAIALSIIIVFCHNILSLDVHMYIDGIRIWQEIVAQKEKYLVQTNKITIKKHAFSVTTVCHKQ